MISKFKQRKDEYLDEGNESNEIKLLEQLYIEISTKLCEYELNHLYLQNNTLPSVEERILTLENDIKNLETQINNNETKINNYKQLSLELENKMTDFIKNSIEIMNNEYVNRDKLTHSFSERVNEISNRLKSLESKKTLLTNEYNALQEELAACMIEFEQQEQEEDDNTNNPTTTNTNNTTTTTNNTTNNSVIEPFEEVDNDDYILEVNEEAAMMYEDYRSQTEVLDRKELQLQYELSQFVDKFSDLSNGLTASNRSLGEHQARVNELENTLLSLEEQQTKGKLACSIYRIIYI